VSQSAATSPARKFAERWALPILLVGVLGAAISPILVRLSEVGPIATAVNRMALPLPLFFALLWFRPRDHVPISTATGRRDTWILILSGVFFAGDLAFWNWSIVLTSVANATVLANTTPVFVVLAGWLLFRDQIRFQFAVGLALALTGVAVMMTESLFASSDNFTGDVLGFVTAWWYAAYILTVARARKRVSTTAVMAVGGTAATIILWILAATIEGDVWPETARGWTIAFALAFVVQVGGQMLIALALAHIPAGLGSMMLFLQPVLAAAFAWALFGETISLWQFIGAGAIIAGIETSRRSHRKRSEINSSPGESSAV
jgi:drug/metabolite transporter (DMT)-like permease